MQRWSPITSPKGADAFDAPEPAALLTGSLADDEPAPPSARSRRGRGARAVALEADPTTPAPPTETAAPASAKARPARSAASGTGSKKAARGKDPTLSPAAPVPAVQEAAPAEAAPAEAVAPVDTRRAEPLPAPAASTTAWVAPPGADTIRPVKPVKRASKRTRAAPPPAVADPFALPSTDAPPPPVFLGATEMDDDDDAFLAEPPAEPAARPLLVHAPNEATLPPELGERAPAPPPVRRLRPPPQEPGLHPLQWAALAVLGLALSIAAGVFGARLFQGPARPTVSAVTATPPPSPVVSPPVVAPPPVVVAPVAAPTAEALVTAPAVAAPGPDAPVAAPTPAAPTRRKPRAAGDTVAAAPGTPAPAAAQDDPWATAPTAPVIEPEKGIFNRKKPKHEPAAEPAPAPDDANPWG